VRPTSGRDPAFHCGHVRVASMAFGEDRLDRSRGLGGLFVPRDRRQPSADRFFDGGIVAGAF
jgi:hypothetical protein